jgi:thymidylate synthase (FAD)
MSTTSPEPGKLTILREPRVYLVGRQQIDDDALNSFLADHDVRHWTTDTSQAGEKLVEVAGRVCYMSFAKPRPGGNHAYIEHILEVGHGSVLEHAVFNLIITGVSRSFTHELVRHRAGFGYCLAADTLIYSDHRCHGRREGVKKRPIETLYRMQLTPHGRSRLRLLRPRCLDETTRLFTNGRVRRVAQSGMREVFRVVLEDGKSITCSRDHRFLTPSGWKPLEEIVAGIRVTSRLAVAHGRLFEPIAVNGRPAYTDKEWLKCQYHDLGRSQASIARECGVAEITVRQWVRKHGLTKSMGSWTKGVSPWNKGKTYRAGWSHSEETRALLAEGKRGVKNPQWRGVITPRGIVLRREAVVLKSSVLERDGFACRLCKARGVELEVHHVLPIWARPDLAAEPSNLAAVCVPCHDAMQGRELEFVERFGLAAPAPETLTPSNRGRGRLLVPRWRKIVRLEYAGVQMTYDIEMEGPHHNFVANGIITHNSQLSQRFVDESEAEFVEPDPIADDPELHQIWLEAITSCQAAYKALADGLAAKFKHIDDRTLRRKKAREAARSVLPNATETKIFVTGNARALRHFIEMRGDAAADAEIRKVALAVLKVLQSDSPNLFGDYALVDLPEGGQAVKTAHRKV